jgi:hypothetical protein
MPMPEVIRYDAAQLDISSRFSTSTTVVGSPALAAETIIAQVAISAKPTPITGVLVQCWAAYTVGTSGTAVTFRVRQSTIAGTIVGNSGALTRAAASLQADTVEAFDATPGATVLYVVTMQVTAGAAASTVSAVVATATVI